MSAAVTTAAATLDKPRRNRSTLAAIANQVVTAILVLAVAAMLVVNVGPLFLPYRVYTVLSGSMEPAIPIGSEVVLRQADASTIQKGDIITFNRPGHAGQLVTHRVVAITQDPATGQRQFLTKGDANAVSDDWRIPATGTGLKYLFHIPLLGYVFAMLQSPIGRICFILAPAMLLAAVVLNDTWKTRAA
jgi:signal peptidase